MRDLPVLTLTAILLAAPSLAGCTETVGDIQVTSAAFTEGDAIPQRYSCEDANISPPLSLDGVPDEAHALALIVDDPDAPDPPFDHWLVWNIPPDTRQIPEDVAKEQRAPEIGDAPQGTNDAGSIGYQGPCPPTGERHTYRFTVYALDVELDLEPASDRAGLDAAMEGHVLDSGRLTGEYGRSG